MHKTMTKIDMTFSYIRHQRQGGRDPCMTQCYPGGRLNLYLAEMRRIFHQLTRLRLQIRSAAGWNLGINLRYRSRHLLTLPAREFVGRCSNAKQLLREQQFKDITQQFGEKRSFRIGQYCFDHPTIDDNSIFGGCYCRRLYLQCTRDDFIGCHWQIKCLCEQTDTMMQVINRFI